MKNQKAACASLIVQKSDTLKGCRFGSRQLPIFPGRLQPSIFDANELNFRVRNGNGWILIAINTGSAYIFQKQCFVKSNEMTRTGIEPMITP